MKLIELRPRFALVVPVEDKVSKRWGPVKEHINVENIPQVMDTGRNMRTERQNVTDSFGRDKHNNVEFFRYTPQKDN